MGGRDAARDRDGGRKHCGGAVTGVPTPNSVAASCESPAEGPDEWQAEALGQPLGLKKVITPAECI